MVLGKLPVPGRPINLDQSRARAYCACSRCGLGIVWTFFSRLSFLFSFSHSLGDDPIKPEILSQRAVKPKTTNQPILIRSMVFIKPFEDNENLFQKLVSVLQHMCTI